MKDEKNCLRTIFRKVKTHFAKKKTCQFVDIIYLKERYKCMYEILHRFV